MIRFPYHCTRLPLMSARTGTQLLKIPSRVSFKASLRIPIPFNLFPAWIFVVSLSFTSISLIFTSQRTACSITISLYHGLSSSLLDLNSPFVPTFLRVAARSSSLLHPTDNTIYNTLYGVQDVQNSISYDTCKSFDNQWRMYPPQLFSRLPYLNIQFMLSSA